MGAFVFGGAQLRDKPSQVTVYLKGESYRVYNITDDRGLMFNPGEPLVRIQTFYAPGDEVVGATVNTDRRVRVIEVIPWEQVLSIELKYPNVEDVDPSVWQRVMPPQMHPGNASGPRVN